MRTLEVYFRLIDQATAPARRVQRAIEAIDRATRQVGVGARSYRALRQELGLSTGAARSLTYALAGVGYARGAVGGLSARFQELSRAAGGAVQQVFNLRNLLVAGAAGMALKVGIDVIAQKEAIMTAFRTLAPGQEQILFQSAIRFAAQTPFETQDVVQAYQQLLTAGFKPIEIPVVLAGVGDLAAMRGFSREVIDRVLLAFQQIRAKGRLQGEELMQLAEAGVPMGKVYEVLAQKIGKSVDEVRKLQEAGRISPDLGIWAVLEALRQTVSGGKLGSLMKQQSETVRGLLSTLRSRPFELLADVDTTPGVRSLKAFLKNLVAVTDTTTALGKRFKERIQAAFGGAFQALFGPLARATAPERLEASLDRLLRGLDDLGSYLTAARDYALQFGAGLGDALRLVREAWDKVKPFARWLTDLVSGLTDTDRAQTSVRTGAVRLAGALTGLMAVWRLLNLVTLGGAGALVRWGVIAATVVLPQVYRLTVALFRMGFAWLAGLGPIGWVIAGVVAVGAVLLWAWNRFSGFREGVRKVLSDIGAWFVALPERVATAFSAFWDWLTSLPSRVYQTLIGLKDAFAKAIADAIRAMPGGEVILRALGAVGAGVRWVGAQVRTGIERGMGVVSGWYQAARNRALGLVQGTQDALGVRSPSRVFEYLGRMSALGYERGLERALPRAIPAPALLVGAIGLSGPQVAAPALPSPPPTAQMVLHLHEGAIRVEAAGDAHEIARAIREELVRLAMEVGHV